MKIVYFFRSLAIWGGIERLIVDKANYFSGLADYDVSILTADQGTHPIPYSISPAVHVEDLGIGLHRRYLYKGLQRLWIGWRLQQLLVRRLRSRIEQLRPDIVVTVATDYVEYAINAIGNRATVIVESHSIFQRTFGQRQHLTCYHDWIRRRSLSAANAIVALTEADAAEWRLHYPMVWCIPNIVNFNPTTRKGSHATRRVIFVGRFDAQKRPELAISIWQRVQPQHPDWELHIYGEGEHQAAVTETAGRARGVVLHKSTASIFDAYCDCAFLIITSLYEPFGLVIPEAMSCGLPVVAFDCPYGPRDIITDGVDGFLVTEGNEQDFADRMTQLMDDDRLCNTMGTAAIQSSLRYAASQIMPQWQQLFNTLTSLPNIARHHSDKQGQHQ